MTSILKLVVFVLSLYVLLLVFLYVLQTYLIFPRRMAARLPVDPAADAEVVWIETSFGRVESWYLPPLSSSGEKIPAVLFAHGNADLISSWPEEFSRFRKWGFGVLLVEYPGYGRSTGKPREQTIVETFVKAYDQLAARPEVDSERIVFFGHSLGGGAVCALARHRTSAAMMLMATFTSIMDMAPRLMLPSLLLKTKFNNLDLVSQYEKPLLVIHGKTDTIIPYSHGLQLHEAAPDSTLLPLECGHNDCTLDLDFWDFVRQFLSRANVLQETDPIESWPGS